MENASKAIIIAGAVLIGILLLSIGVSLWRNYANFSEENAQSTRAQQLEEFNVKFRKYEYNGTNPVTAQDVRTIVNLAKNYNSKYEEEIIEVFFRGAKGISAWNDEKWINFLNEGNSNEKKYAITTNDNNGNSDIITRIDIKEVS